MIGESYLVRKFEKAKDLISAIMDGQRPYLLIADIHMPQMNGIQMNSLLIEMGLEIPVIFISGEVLRDHAMIAVEQKVVAFLEKPFEPTVFKEKVQKAVSDSIKGKVIKRLVENYRNLSNSSVELANKYQERFTNAENLIYKSNIDYSKNYDYVRHLLATISEESVLEKKISNIESEIEKVIEIAGKVALQIK